MTKFSQIFIKAPSPAIQQPTSSNGTHSITGKPNLRLLLQLKKSLTKLPQKPVMLLIFRHKIKELKYIDNKEF